MPVGCSGLPEPRSSLSLFLSLCDRDSGLLNLRGRELGRRGSLGLQIGFYAKRQWSIPAELRSGRDGRRRPSRRGPWWIPAELCSRRDSRGGGLHISV